MIKRKANLNDKPQIKRKMDTLTESSLRKWTELEIKRKKQI